MGTQLMLAPSYLDMIGAHMRARHIAAGIGASLLVAGCVADSDSTPSESAGAEATAEDGSTPSESAEPDDAAESGSTPAESAEPGDVAESDPAPSESEGPHDSSAEVRPDLMEIEPTTAAPGEVLSVGFPQETQRGVAFVLEEEVASDWELRSFLVAGSESEGAAEWWTPDDADGHGWDDVGVLGPGPDFVEVPSTATPGDYRLCTANAGENLCVLLTITE